VELAAPDHLRGRVIGLYFYAFNGTGAIAGIMTGWLCAKGGTELAFAAPHHPPPRRAAAARLIRSPGAGEDGPSTVERGGSGVSHHDVARCGGSGQA
jgi:hypothetical protein